MTVRTAYALQFLRANASTLDAAGVVWDATAFDGVGPAAAKVRRCRQHAARIWDGSPLLPMQGLPAAGRLTVRWPRGAPESRKHLLASQLTSCTVKTQPQVTMVRALPAEVVLVFSGDEAGVGGAWELAQ